MSERYLGISHQGVITLPCTSPNRGAKFIRQIGPNKLVDVGGDVLPENDTYVRRGCSMSSETCPALEAGLCAAKITEIPYANPINPHPAEILCGKIES